MFTNYGFAVYALTGGKHVVNACYLLKTHLRTVIAEYMIFTIIRIKYINISTKKVSSRYGGVIIAKSFFVRDKCGGTDIFW